jgi:uncharacterized membrane protein HdeD (DUF308 family)
MKIVLALRAIIAFGVGVFITFNQSHSASIGLTALAIFGIGYAILNSVGNAVWGKGITSVESMPLSVVAVIVGVFALLIPSTDPFAQAMAFIYLVTGWGLVAGAFELYLARREGLKTRNGKDALINAVLSLALGVLFLVAPLDIVSAVGFFGAYLALSGIHLAIAAATPSK